MEKRFREVNTLFLITIVIYILITSVLGQMSDVDEMVLLVIGQVVLIAPYVVYILLTKQNVAECIRIRKIKPTNAFLLVVFAIAIYPFLGFVNALSMMFAKNVIQQRVVEMTENNPFILNVIVIALIPCILEEFVYRGVIYNEYRKVNVIKGILLSSLLFGLMHRNLNQFTYTFVMAVILAFLLEVTDSIWAPIIVHFTINGTSITISSLTPILLQLLHETGVSGEGFQFDAANISKEWLWLAIQTLGVMSVVSILIGALIIVAVAKSEGRYERLRQPSFWMKKPDGERLLTFPLVAGICICVSFIILGLVSR